MFKKILIANRGEIAIRIIRACNEMGIKTVAVYSKADKNSLHVKFADEAICIGKGPAVESYLNIPRIIAAGEITNADAIHPGYGFLAENAKFSKICKENGFTFIGPDAEIIDLMGDKVNARNAAKDAGVPIIPGSNTLSSVEEFLEISEQIGYPVMLKAVAGGGGKGMRVIKNANEAEKGFNIIQNEAGMAFNNSEIYVEKFVENGRHIEVQILSDKFGNHLHLGERECSIQRSNQKLIEESPSLFVDDNLRDELTSKSLQLAKKVNYVGAGTIEYLVDDDKNFYFIEMNTRIQVEHTVTEMVCMIDLVKEQIRTYAGIKLSIKQENITMSGHAIECRINAEDPSKNFQPSPGTIGMCHQPSGFRTRVDGAIFQGYKVTPYYDSMVCKLICHGRNRTEAIQRMNRSLDEFVIEGITTTIPLHKKLLNHKKFINSDFNVSWLDKDSIV